MKKQLDKIESNVVSIEVMNNKLAIAKQQEQLAMSIRNIKIAHAPKLATPSITMSSLEIAELTGKRHANVKRDIIELLNKLDLDVLRFEHIYLDTRNREQLNFNLPKRECDLLMMGYSIKLRAAVYDRWVELESGTATPSGQANVQIDEIATLKIEAEKAKLQASIAISNNQIGISNDKAAIVKSRLNVREAYAVKCIESINAKGVEVVELNVTDKASRLLLPAITMKNAMIKSPSWKNNKLTSTKWIGFVYRVLEEMGYVSSKAPYTYGVNNEKVSKALVRTVTGKGLSYGRNSRNHTIIWFDYNSNKMMEDMKDYYDNLDRNQQLNLMDV